MHPTFLQRRTRHSGDIRRELSERPVEGTSACVCEVDEAKITLEVNKIDGLGSFTMSSLRRKVFVSRGRTE